MKANISSLSLSLLATTLLLFSASWSPASNALSSFSDQKGILRIAGVTAHIPVMAEAASVTIEELLLSLKPQCTLIMVSHYQDQLHRIADLHVKVLNGRFYID